MTEMVAMIDRIEPEVRLPASSGDAAQKSSLPDQEVLPPIRSSLDAPRAPKPGENSDFVALYQQQYPRIVAYAQRRVGNTADAEDIAAEVFRLAWERLELPSIGWLFVTARNTVMAYNRKARQSDAIRDRIGGELAVNGLSSPQSVQAERIRDGLILMDEPERELLMAVYWDDLSGAQCAQLLGCSIGAVWVRLHRSRQNLKSILTSLNS